MSTVPTITIIHRAGEGYFVNVEPTGAEQSESGHPIMTLPHREGPYKRLREAQRQAAAILQRHTDLDQPDQVVERVWP